jgi:hypothetical protein
LRASGGSRHRQSVFDWFDLTSAYTRIVLFARSDSSNGITVDAQALPSTHPREPTQSGGPWMTSHWIDDLSRITAGGMPRRTAIRRLGGGLLGVFAAVALHQDASAITIGRGQRDFCSGQCTSGQTCCESSAGPICANTSTDTQNCGGCRRVCRSGAQCVNGRCSAACVGQNQACGGGQTCCTGLSCRTHCGVLQCLPDVKPSGAVHQVC